MTKRLVFLCLFVVLVSLDRISHQIEITTNDWSDDYDNYTTDANGTDSTSTTTTDTRPNYCPELLPYCTCMASPAIVKCSGFASFDQLDFTKLDNDSYLRNQTLEIELQPQTPLTLDSSLDLSQLSFDENAKIILRFIDGFNLLHNPFSDLRDDNKLFLYIYESIIRTTGANCDLNSLPIDFDLPGLFASFDYIYFGINVIFQRLTCPLLFNQANISFIEAYYMTSDNYLRFEEIQNAPDDFDLNSYVGTFKIAFANPFVVSNKMLNQYVFRNLSQFNLDNIRLARIEDDAFVHTQRLTRIFLTLENVEEFIRTSDNKWMSELNVDVVVNYTNPVSVELNQERALVIQINDRNSGKSYLYPDEDITYFQYFPYDRMVFFRILTVQNIDCTSTMSFLLQNALYYDPPSYLNTTSAYKCLLVNTTSSTTTRSTSSGSSTPTTTSNTTTTTKKPDSTVPLATFLAVVIPLGIISIVGVLGIIFLTVKLCKNAPAKTNNVELSKF